MQLIILVVTVTTLILKYGLSIISDGLLAAFLGVFSVIVIFLQRKELYIYSLILLFVTMVSVVIDQKDVGRIAASIMLLIVFSVVVKDIINE